MRQYALRQYGYHLTALALVLFVLGVIAYAGWAVFSKKQTPVGTSATTQIRTAAATQPYTQPPAYVNWSFDGNSWRSIGSAPACEAPLSIIPPMDITRATSVLYPGQVRGGDFKPHGGLAIDNATNTGAVIFMVRDGFLYQGAWYIENGEPQYLLDFIDPCGIRFRYDHLAVLTDALKQYGNQLPGPLVDDSRTHPIASRPFFTKGTAIATEIGHKKQLNVGFDLGVYDLRQRNTASKTPLYKTDSARINDKEQSFYAVCWFDLLPDRERTIVNALPPRGGVRENTSDYCD